MFCNIGPWFRRSVAKEDPFTDYYVWVDPKGFDSDGNPIPPSNWVSQYQVSSLYLKVSMVKLFKNASMGKAFFKKSK